MNKNIERAFDHGKAFVAFVTCGDPDLDTTKKIILALERAGCDLIELGIPFSDPTAEGPVIQEANERALSNGCTTDDVFEMIKEVRKETSIPMVFMTYANVVFHYGTDKFCQKMIDANMSGMILPDVPYEEKDEFETVCHQYGLDFIRMIAPTSHDRIKMIANDAQGFLYCVSSLGVTGTRSKITTNVNEMVDIVRSVSDIPCGIGFGISTPEQAKKMTEKADAAIVGSAIIKIIAKYGKEAPDHVEAYVRSMVEAIR
ncbi:MAG: tryptophan synthase subunit alpha [Absicoccus porci]|uniref:Tryptophan synthase alpha chain n=1 Tax=Absicoccus porci TaxID=2486576 RepID=A0A3N0I3J5_9FIRM|nr:tryptophan synthase subunit alpha [Absicoccus porci]MCI6088168.1 tryptophan synthase subunit alpha [Absicoccus porci]MDD7329652.1 tryptophan synthase subunit alpha [Absicoccus porci]MDY4739374.1 tryptophan synthase subunit alpha [Absicoccus porci]RNM31146.1 tryptophan synthase subunit alpha [Absicoccus porci]